jgi:alpha-galactosidase
MRRWGNGFHCWMLVAGLAAIHSYAWASGHSEVLGMAQGQELSALVYADGSYAITRPGAARPVIRSNVGAVVDAVALSSAAYPHHVVAQSESTLTVTHSGLAGRPDLVCVLRLRRDQPWGEITVEVKNTTGHPISVQSIRSVAATGVDLGATPAADRILSDSFSEDRPQLAIRDLGAGPQGLHRAVGSQVIYNRRSGESLFLGALTSERLLTIFHLRAKGAGIASYDVDATGTTEILKGESLAHSAAADQIDLRLPVAPGESLGSERLMFAVGTDYHAQLEAYGSEIRQLHSARVSAATPIGWWSWTAYYFGVNQGTMRTNADWMAQNLKQLGYTYFQIDEGYQYARGEYTTADGALFPEGVAHIANAVTHDGLTFGVWTAPFEVSERAWVYQHHKEWLVHNAAGEPIHIGFVTNGREPLYCLDTTHPGAQEYLRQTYSLLRSWGVRFIKMDFMDDTAIEGVYFRANTTALEAQRIGLQIIRDAVGAEVVLDKDGSPMLNPVGLVDAGRISQDTGHTFEATRDAASGVAARYYMNRNFFISDPDAFSVSTQTIMDQAWHGGQHPLTLDEAKMSIALSAVSGGMFEIGDDLPMLGASPERLSLVKSADLLDVARLGRAATPIDLLSYEARDLQPSIFLLVENHRQALLTVFNWSEESRARVLDLAKLGLRGHYRATEVFGAEDCCELASGTIKLTQKPHSVRIIKLVDDQDGGSLAVDVRGPAKVAAGDTALFEVQAGSPEQPVLNGHWNFGDGTSADGIKVQHAYTTAGTYEVAVRATGLGSLTTNKTQKVVVDGTISTRFEPARNKRADVSEH